MKRSLVLTALALMLPMAARAQTGQVVGPNGVVASGTPGNWTPDIQAGAFGQVTTTNPRCGFGGACAGSLALSVTGNQRVTDGQYPDWAFYSLNAPTPGGFGSLSSLDLLSFDWYRMSDPTWNTTNVASDWPFKTPVFRVSLADDNGRRSDLVWEGYYNRAAGESLNGGPTPVDQWITSDLLNDNFWVNLLPTTTGQQNMILGPNCDYEPFDFWRGGVPAFSITQLVGTGGCLASDNLRVVGLAVGVGSQWPLPYTGYVDNVRMGFDDSEDLAVNTNFDVVATTTTPEPSTWALMITGLFVLGGVSAARRRNGASRSA